MRLWHRQISEKWLTVGSPHAQAPHSGRELLRRLTDVSWSRLLAGDELGLPGPAARDRRRDRARDRCAALHGQAEASAAIAESGRVVRASTSREVLDLHLLVLIEDGRQRSESEFETSIKQADSSSPE